MIVRMGSKFRKMTGFSHEFRVCVTVFVVLSMAYMVEGDPVLKIANVGDVITLSCYRDGVHDDNYKRWYQNSTSIADWTGVYIDDPRYTQRNVDGSSSPDSNIIFISNVRISDSSLFTCKDYYNSVILSYDVRVIGCSNCILTIHENPNKTKVICSLDNYWAEQNTLSQVKLKYANRPTDYYTYRNTSITKNLFSFEVYKTEWDIIHSDFYLDINNNQEKRITCTLPPTPTTPSHTSTTQQTTQNVTTTSPYRPTSLYGPGPTVISVTLTKLYPPQNKNVSSDKPKMHRNIIIIAPILGSVFILILFSVIIVIRRYKKRQVNKRNSSEVFYESVHDASPREPATKEMVETNIDQQNADHPESVNMIDSQKLERREENIKSHEYMHLIKDPAKQVDQEETTENYTSLVNYGNSMVQPSPNWKESGACPRQDDQYDDVIAQEKGNDNTKSHEYMHLIMDPAKQVDQKETTENYTSLVNYGNSMVQPPPNWKESGACPRQDNQYDDVTASEEGNDHIEGYYSEMK